MMLSVFGGLLALATLSAFVGLGIGLMKVLEADQKEHDDAVREQAYSPHPRARQPSQVSMQKQVTPVDALVAVCRDLPELRRLAEEHGYMGDHWKEHRDTLEAEKRYQAWRVALERMAEIQDAATVAIAMAKREE